MRLSNSFFYTKRDDVKDEQSISGNLLVRSGMIEKTASGIYMFLPLGNKVKQNIEKIIKEEMEKAGSQEVIMPMLISGEIFEKSGRRNAFGSEMFSLKDRYQKDYILGPTHEELFVLAAKKQIKSYKNMPINLYQIGNKYRDEARPRYGLIRAREFVMKDAYSFDIDKKHTDITYDKMKKAYNNSFDKMELDYRIVKSDTGAMGGDLSEEYQALSSVGEDTIVLCESCDFSSNLEVAEVKVEEVKKETPKKLKEVYTPNVHTIEEVSNYLKIDSNKLAKTLVYKIDDEIVFILVKGNRTLNESKLQKVMNAKEIVKADENDLKTITDASFGFLGPIDIKNKIIIDNEVAQMSNFTVGANKDNYHYINCNLDDFEIHKTADIINIEQTDKCPKCGKKLLFKKSIEIGNIFKLGTKYSESLDLTYLDEKNKSKYVDMGCYGIGITRCISAIVEQHHDEKGIIWPLSVAPYKVCIIPMNKEEEVIKYSEDIYNKLSKKIDVLLDDRNERPGVKFNDMDLIGIPIQIIVGKKLKENKVEIRLRDKSIEREIDKNSVIEGITNILK